MKKKKLHTEICRSTLKYDKLKAILMFFCFKICDLLHYKLETTKKKNNKQYAMRDSLYTQIMSFLFTIILNLIFDLLLFFILSLTL